ncbi:MAG: lysophospholipid acyltransferase family protein [Planctomycetota bacterium]
MRTALRWAFVIAWTAVLWAAALACRFLSPGGALIHRLSRFWARAILAVVGVRLRVWGRDRVRGGPFVVVANHSSMLDICVAFVALPVQFRFVSRPFFFRVPFLGWGMALAGHISLDPRKPREARAVLRTLADRLARGTSVLLFPEGTRSPDGRVRRYKRGPFLTAIRSGVAVLPICLDGLFEALPKGARDVRPGAARVVIGEPIQTSGLGAEDAASLADRAEEWTRATKEDGAAAGGVRG